VAAALSHRAPINHVRERRMQMGDTRMESSQLSSQGFPAAAAQSQEHISSLEGGNQNYLPLLSHLRKCANIRRSVCLNLNGRAARGACTLSPLPGVGRRTPN